MYSQCNHHINYKIKIHKERKKGKNKVKLNYKAKGYHTTLDGVPVRKLYVSNLCVKVTNVELFKLFQNFGRVQNVFIVPPFHPFSSTSYGFVTFYTPEEASSAIEARIFLRCRKLFVSAADSWHQPEELPNGEIIWDKKATQKDNEIVEEAEDEIEETVVEYDAETCPIMSLNDDCLHLIFNYLDIRERVLVGQVCRRWRKLNDNMWFSMKKLDFTTLPLSLETLTNNTLKLFLNLCPNVTALNANTDHDLDANAIVTIAKHCPQLEELTLRSIPMQKRSLALLAKSCPNLTSFYMLACSDNHDYEMVNLVKNCRNLKKIGLKYSLSSSGAWLKHIRCPLESLSLELYELKPENLLQGIERVQTTLKELSFVTCPSIRSSDFGVIANLVPNLTCLRLAGVYNEISFDHFLPITKLKKLLRLDFEQNVTVRDEFIEELAENCTSLVHLNLTGTEFYYLSETALSSITKLKNLTHLGLSYHIELSDEVLKSLSNSLKSLKHLDIMGCQSISDAGCINIITNCKELESLDISNCLNITNTTINAAFDLIEKGDRRKLHIITGGSGVLPDMLFIKPEISHYIILDRQTTAIPGYDDASDYDEYNNSDFSFVEFDFFEHQYDDYDYDCEFDTDSDIDSDELLLEQIYSF